jgi:AraC family transcriptional regulator
VACCLLEVPLLRGHGQNKFTASELLVSSAGRDWPLLAVDIRRHIVGPIAPFVTASTELTLIMRSDRPATVLRAAHGIRQCAPARPGSTFITPVNTVEETTFLTDDIAEVMHIYLSDELFTQIADEEDLPRFHQSDIRYLCGVNDPSLFWMARRVYSELSREPCSGQTLVELLALNLAERMVLRYTEGITARGPGKAKTGGLDNLRMRRVLEFIQENLHQHISVRDMASIACLSPFHFARAFSQSTGRPPCRYLSEQRLSLAKGMLRNSDKSILEIADVCCFSSQANFTRAFSAAVGMPPAVYRRSQ